MRLSTRPAHHTTSLHPLLQSRETPAFPQSHFRTTAADGTGGPFTIGRVLHSSRGVGFTGWIGGVAIFNRALSAGEINELAKVAKQAPVSATSPR